MGALAASLGPASKNPPPLNGDVTCGGAAGARWVGLVVRLLKLAKGSDFGCD